MIPAEAIEAAQEAVKDAMIEHGPDGHIDGYEEITRSALEAAAPHMLVHVHHHDIEHHARSFNEGYDKAVTQGLADEPSLADDWLQAKLREARAEALEAAADIAGRPENRWWAEGRNRAKWLRALAASERGSK